MTSKLTIIGRDNMVSNIIPKNEVLIKGINFDEVTEKRAAIALKKIDDSKKGNENMKVAKYIHVMRDNEPCFLVFGIEQLHTDHYNERKKEGDILVSAGFYSFFKGEYVAYGSSEGLGYKALPCDTDLLKELIFPEVLDRLL